ncbi:MAG: I78 family peptidase inhibitor [Sulfitobacter sp.]
MRFIIFSLLILGGCGEVATNNAATTPRTSGADTCNAAAYAGLIGQDAVTALAVPEPKREYRIGQPVTSDYNAQRVNIKLDDTDIIVAIDCG